MLYFSSLLLILRFKITNVVIYCQQMVNTMIKKNRVLIVAIVTKASLKSTREGWIHLFLSPIPLNPLLSSADTRSLWPNYDQWTGSKLSHTVIGRGVWRKVDDLSLCIIFRFSFFRIHSLSFSLHRSFSLPGRRQYKLQSDGLRA